MHQWISETTKEKEKEKEKKIVELCALESKSKRKGKKEENSLAKQEDGWEGSYECKYKPQKQD